MTDYFTGIGGSDAASGTSWTNHRRTIVGGLALAINPGDRLIVAPGVYPENPNLTHSGTSGNPITILGDNTGALTTGNAGSVFITGSNNNKTANRANAITGSSGLSFITLSCLTLGNTSSTLLLLDNPSNVIVQCCNFQDLPFSTDAINYTSLGQTSNCTVRRCRFLQTNGIEVDGTALNVGFLVESCIFLGQAALWDGGVGGINFRNNTVTGGSDGSYVVVTNGPASGASALTVNNCCLINGYGQLADGSFTGWAGLLEDYNNLCGNPGNGYRVGNVATGAHSISVFPRFVNPKLLGTGVKDTSNYFLKPTSLSGMVSAGSSSNKATTDFYGNTFSSTPDIGAVAH